MSNQTAQMINLGNGKEALNLIPELAGTAALVDLGVVKRLASMLPKANVNDIIRQMTSQLNTLEMDDHNNDDKLVMFVDILSDEVAFHKTINLIATVEVPAKVEVDMAMVP